MRKLIGLAVIALMTLLVMPSGLSAAQPEAKKRYKVSVCDWMILKRQKIGELTLSGLDRGAVRRLTQEEVFYLKNL